MTTASTPGPQPQPVPSVPDGRLVRISEATWRGRLNGYVVDVFTCQGFWYGGVMHPRGYTVVQLAAADMRGAASKARAWIEANPLTELTA